MSISLNDPRIIVSIAAVALSLAAGIGVALLARRLNISPEQRLRTRNVLRYAIFLLLCFFLLVVWAEALRTAALIASAFGVAIVLACKEILMCVGGWWLKTLSGAYRIGDRVQIGPHRGDVIDYGVLTTTLVEVGSGSGSEYELRSGSVVVVPNSLLLSEVVRNATHTLKYIWRELDFILPKGADWEVAEQSLIEAARAEIADHREAMAAQLQEMERNFAFHAIGAEPSVFVSQTDDGGVRLTLRVGLPVKQLRSLQDRITRRFLNAQKG